MQADIFKDILVPVVGGLGIFMLGLEFMSNGIQALAVSRMRTLLGQIAGTPIKGVMAGTFITGIIQSSTAMTVMVVGLVNAGVLGLRPAISVIMGANIGTTLGNGLIALPLGPLGLLLAGFFALIYVFSNNHKVRNIALACIGFSLIFYGLNLMTGGLRPLRSMPEVMEAISSLNADNFTGLITCVLIAAGITAMIHSSSATIGIVMGLGAAGVLEWQTAVAFSLGADLGTTITSWIASLNLTKNAKRAAYAHISFNFIGVAVMLPLFFPSMILLTHIMGWFGGDPGVAQVVDGKEIFPLVPVAVGIYSTCFNLFNTALLFPFVSVFERVLLRVGHDASEDVEDYSHARYLDPKDQADPSRAVPAVQKELARYLDAARLFLDIGRGSKTAPKDTRDHYSSTDILSREIRTYTAGMFRPELPYAQTDLVASLIEEADFTASLGETLYQTARRVERENFSTAGRALAEVVLDKIAEAMTVLAREADGETAVAADVETRLPEIAVLREQCLKLGPELPAAERGSLLALLGSAERAFVLIERIDAERRSVSRTVRPRPVAETGPELPLAGAPVPA
ncbi:Na/Pi cotransporter family protein [Flaviflagellibacter deserti]|uniref:Na/Pi cotransporter family protein n=1 Tax=Flaviflagellibacter deserti TaxID=2267266 RepID=A0ABV9YZ32_9HYPH